MLGMGRNSTHHQRKKKKRAGYPEEKKLDSVSSSSDKKKLELVLKCDSVGCAEAVETSIKAMARPEVDIEILSSGVGAINKSDIFMAETGSRLIIGFNVGVLPEIKNMPVEHNVEVRIYDVIYRLVEDVSKIAASIIPREVTEKIIGSAKVIALFKSSRKGIILGCEVLNGTLALGQKFRVVGAMGPIYSGTIESLHIEKDAVNKATRGQQVGLKIRDFKKAKIGDLVESFKQGPQQVQQAWQPKGVISYR
jgi:translation initiation factor IF-2